MNNIIFGLFISMFAVSTANSQEHTAIRLIKEAVSASNNGDSKTACRKGRQALEVARKDKGEGRAAAVKMITDFNNGVCQDATDPYNCVGYNNAKQTCAPAANFPACMGRLGFGAEITRQVCRGLSSVDGW
jgi:hypothetical protein